MQYCSRCLYPANHPLHITFDAQGVCSGCRVHEEKMTLDWSKREQKLRALLSSFKNQSGRNFDCIVPVSGARDSHFIVHKVRNVYGLNPLLVTYNKQYNTKAGIRNLAYLRTLTDRDYMQLTVSPLAVKKITRVTLAERASMYWHCLAGQTVFPVQVAVRFKIPLIIWGVHQGCDQVGMFSHTDEVEMTRKYRKDHDLMGLEAEDLIGKGGLTEDDVRPFMYPHDKELEKVGVRGIYLGNYIPWDTKRQHEEMIRLYGYETMAQTRTFDTYNDVDCFNYSDVHDMIKFMKWGYGKVVDHAVRELRWGRLTREEAIDLVQKFQSVLPKYLPLFLEWLGISEKNFYEAVNAHRDPAVWGQDAQGQWRQNERVSKAFSATDIESVRLDKREACDFRVTPSRNPGTTERKYILIGRGYIDEATDQEE